MTNKQLGILEDTLRAQLDGVRGVRREAVEDAIAAVSHTLNRDGVPFDFVDRINFRKHCGVTW